MPKVASRLADWAVTVDPMEPDETLSALADRAVTVDPMEPDEALSALEALILAPATEPQRVALLASARSDMERIFYSHDGLIADKWSHYLEIYDRHLGRYRGEEVRLLEIGVQNGGSLEIWRRYLGPQAFIQGLDVDPRCAAIVGLDEMVVIGDQSDPAVLASVAGFEPRPLDVVIDDGSHLWRDQISTFETLFPLLAEDGVYVCEDVHTSFIARFGDESGVTFIDYARGLVDRMHAAYDGTSDPGVARSVFAVHVYDSMVVVEKRRRERPLRVLVGRR